MKYAVIIPAYNPDDKFVAFIEILRKNGIFVIAVDDGSRDECESRFQTGEERGCVVIHHDGNKGKGLALRTGFAELIRLNQKGGGFAYAITADCDGQHSYEAIKDVAQAAEASMETQDGPALIIGGRFRDTGEKVPLRSRLGNGFTRGLFRLVTGVAIYDTQTGLRAIPERLFKEMLELKGDRYEYEMNMLMEARLRHIEILEIPIETVYIEENKSSHFRPFRDSVKIYSVFFKHLSKFVISSMSATVIDFAIYAIMLNAVFGYTEENTSFLDNLTDYRIVISFIVARILSSAFNFIINKYVVFKERKRNPKEVAKYYAIVVVVFLCTVLLNSYYFQRVIVFK